MLEGQLILLISDRQSISSKNASNLLIQPDLGVFPKALILIQCGIFSKCIHLIREAFPETFLTNNDIIDHDIKSLLLINSS